MRKQQGDGDDRLQERQGQIPELPPGGSAVDGRGLVGLGRQAGETRQHQQEDERRPLPDIGDDDREHGEIDVAGPGLQRQAELEHDLVEHAELRLVDQLPGDGHGDRRQHHRQHQQRLEEVQPADVPVEKQGQAEAENETRSLTAQTVKTSGVPAGRSWNCVSLNSAENSPRPTNSQGTSGLGLILFTAAQNM